MAKINLTQLGSMQGMDNDQAIRRIESYLFTLNEQLRYELTHIDEDNMAVNNTPARQVSAGSGESSGSTQADGQTIDLNDNPLIRQLKARLAELQTSQKQAVEAINNNTKSITDALKEINNVKNRTWSYPSHRHSVQIDGSGNLTMGGPTVNPTYPNIAATAYVQELVAAARRDGKNSVTVENGDIVRDGQDDYSPTTHKTTIYVEATASNGASGTQSFTTDTAAYDDGKNSVNVRSWGKPSWNASGVTITITLSNGAIFSNFYPE